MLLLKWDEKIKKILSEDNYNCMENDNEEAYNRLMEIFPVKLNISITALTNEGGKRGGETYLRRMPYSACVPKLFIEMKDFVNNCVKFAEGLNSRYARLHIISHISHLVISHLKKPN